MSASKLPDHASFAYLKNLATDRLRELRRSDPGAKLATALHAVARDHGFPSWRALKAELELRRATRVRRFLEACGAGEAEAVRAFLADDPDLGQASHPGRPHAGWTALHDAAKRGHAEVVRLLLGAVPTRTRGRLETTPARSTGLRLPAICRSCARSSTPAPMCTGSATRTRST